MLIDRTTLNTVLQNLYVLTGVRVAVFDEWQREIAAYPSSICDYCREHRSLSAFDELCRISDAKAFETAEKTRLQYTYRCHAGLYESVCPIVSDNVVIGFLMIGQFLGNGDPTKDREGTDYGNDIQQLPMDKVQSIAAIMSICAEYLCFSKTISIRRTGNAERARQYVIENLNAELTVQDIANALGLSRTSTHTLFRQNFGKSVTEYVNSQRIELAKNMIAEKRTTAEIIEAIHISDPNYFYRMFKKHTGMTVSEYKAMEIFRSTSKI